MLISTSSCQCVYDMIEKLKITQIRNLYDIDLNLSSCNVFVGQNGSGKTSLLEAVFLLSRGKSFRHHEPKRLITHHQSSCTVWAKTTLGELGIQKILDDKSFATSVMKRNGQNVYSQSVLSFALPTLLIDPSGMELLEEGSGGRRQLLDWLVFHVEHRFYGAWLSYQKVLKQRNALLKSSHVRQRPQEITAWDYELSCHAQVLHECRQAVFENWRVYFKAMLGRLLPKYTDHINLSYQAGFDEKVGLFHTLGQRLESDIMLGYTRVGSHRADVLVNFYNDSDKKFKEQAVNVLSRGEKKLLITALKLSQLQMICASGGMPVVLIDDVDAELDEWAVDILLDVVLSLPCQSLMTSLQQKTAQQIQEKLAKSQPSPPLKMFHVEQGVVREALPEI